MLQRHQKRLIALALALLGGLLLLVILDKPPALPAVMILPPGPLAVKSGRAPDRWIPAKWVWVHRASQFFLGAPRQVGFNVRFMETSATVASIVAEHSLGQPQAESNGVAVWFLPEGTFRPSKGEAILSAPRVSTADRMEATVMVSDSAARDSADLFARLEKGSVDLSTRLIVTTAGQTNFVAAARAQLPYGRALFMLDMRQPASASNRMEFVITADEYDAYGNKVHGKERK